jgi:LysM repeat protein
MALVGGFAGKVNSAQNYVKNPFKDNVDKPFDGPDFTDGFVINEILSDGSEGDSVVLVGNMLPKDKLKYGGSQRIKKEFYSGYSEPTMQVFGPEETDLTINGKFKDKKYSKPEMKGVALEIAQQIDAIRIRGSIVRIRLGEFERFAIILRTDFDMIRITDVDYSITFSIIGFNAPKNAIFIQKNKEFPFAINKDLIAQAAAFESERSSIPATVPRSIAETINGLISDVSSAVKVVTDFVDTVISTVDDVRSSVERAKGLVKYAQNKIRSYQRTVGSFNAFDSAQALTGRYENAKFYSSSASSSVALSKTLQQLKRQLAGLSDGLPLGRHLVRQDDTLQKIAIKFYGTADNWKKIYDFNGLTSTQLVNGRLLNIPRL